LIPYINTNKSHQQQLERRGRNSSSNNNNNTNFFSHFSHFSQNPISLKPQQNHEIPSSNLHQITPVDQTTSSKLQNAKKSREIRSSKAQKCENWVQRFSSLFR
jgi:hypothetical protein